MKLKDLIGYKLESIDDDKIIVSKDNKKYILKIEENYGDCCGYNQLKTELLIDENNSPIIINITDDEKSIYGEGYESSSARITFYGSNKKIATLDSMSSSGSGWCYGACVSIKCDELNINEIITEW